MPGQRSCGYPLFLDLRGQPVLVVGGGKVAVRKIRGLLKAGAQVTAVAPRFVSSLEPWNRRALGGRVRLLRRPFRLADLHKKRLVFAATGDSKLNAHIAQRARRRGVWTNVAAPPEAGDVQVPACLRRGRLCLAVSTGGASAAAAKSLRKWLALHVDGAWSVYLALLEARRPRIKAAVRDPRVRRRLLQALGRVEWVSRIRRQGRAEAGRQMDAKIRRAAEKKSGH